MTTTQDTIKEKDRQLLIEFQNYLWNTKGGMMPMHPKNIEFIADIFLSQRESREEKDAWIPVSERLPDNGLYIISYFNPSHPHDKYVIPLWFTRGEWYYESYERGRAEGETLKVTHWQPLPEIPKSK